MSKTALARVTGSTHLAGWARGIRAFDLMPGVVRTDMTEAMGVHAGRTEWTDPGEVTDLVLALVSGDLDAWSGRFVRAGTDTVDSLGRPLAGLARTSAPSPRPRRPTPSPDPPPDSSVSGPDAPSRRDRAIGAAASGPGGACA